MSNTDDHFSDDEIFFGPLTIKELKKHIFPNIRNRQTVGYVNKSFEDESNKSLRLIETHSTPNVAFVSNPVSIPSMTKPSISSPDVMSDWEIKDTDDSFLKIEKLVEDLCVSPREKKEELDNTLEVVEYILRNEPDSNKIHIKSCESSFKEYDEELMRDKFLNVEANRQVSKVESDTQLQILVNKTPDKENELSKYKLAATPINKNDIKVENDNYTTPYTKLKPKTPIFKTPGNLVPHKKPSVTPLKKQYEHIVSPVASYIKNSPIVPLVKNVRPNKLLPSSSLIPQPIKNSSKMNMCNKENMNLPTTAYKSAKETQVIDVPDEHKLPMSQWAKQVASSIPKGVVMKHVHRETSSVKRHLVQHLAKQEVSFNDLSLHQADLSVCIKKSTFNKP